MAGVEVVVGSWIKCWSERRDNPSPPVWSFPVTGGSSIQSHEKLWESHTITHVTECFDGFENDVTDFTFTKSQNPTELELSLCMLKYGRIFDWHVILCSLPPSSKNPNWGNIFWKNGVHTTSPVPETVVESSSAKMKTSESSEKLFYKTILFFFFCRRSHTITDCL